MHINKEKGSWIRKHPRTYVYLRIFFYTALGAFCGYVISKILSFSAEEARNMEITISCLSGILLGYITSLIKIVRSA